MKALWKIVTAAVLAVAPVVTVAGTSASADEAPGTVRTTPDAEQAAYIRTLPPIYETSVGPYVLTLQARLIRYGYDLEGTGFFGPKTKAAVADWQRKHGISASGHVGVQTWTSLLGCNFLPPLGLPAAHTRPGEWFPEGDYLSYQGMVNDLQWIFPNWARMSPEFSEGTRTGGWMPYDDTAVDTVQNLQARLGLFPSGQIGPQTTAALDLIDSVAFSRGYQNICG